MLPSILSKQLEEGIRKYISSSYPMANEPFKGSLQNFLNEKDSVYHEPYIAVRLPFRLSDRKNVWFESIHPTFAPYVHQAKAFDRLNGDDGQSTLIATGTGSGKTECFLYPILEYCYQHRADRGIKALIIYPMNALATDQAGRIASLIYNSPELKGNVTAGLFVGDKEEIPNTVMKEDAIITDRDVMLNNPPDILLTNYKMLDYLLVRPRDSALWKENNPYTLKYIAVDELHTFDGAQGTDLACLLRRLKSRLYTQPGTLCCIGTSATLGAKENSESIRKYAEEIFGEQFDEESVITEDRISPTEFFADKDITDYKIPTDDEVAELAQLIKEDDPDEFLQKSVSAWLDDFHGDIHTDEGKVQLSNALMHHSFFQSVIRLMGGNYYQVSEIVEDLRSAYPDVNNLKDSDTAVNALFALVSYARIDQAGHLRPFLNVQVQLWMRELARLLGKVDGEKVTYAVATDLNSDQAKHYLPVVNCRNCGTTGWATILNERNNAAMTDLRGFYDKFFKADPKILLMYPGKADENNHNTMPGTIDADTMQVEYSSYSEGNTKSSRHRKIPIMMVHKLDKGGRASARRNQIVCPFCGSKTGITLIGMRSTMEISNSVSQMFASKFNDDKKTLAFSDNVQDAAHKAGFLNNRSWRFGMRVAIQHFLNEEGRGLSLQDFTNKFLEYWHNKLSDEEYAGYFIAPNLVWMRGYEDMLKNRRLGAGRDANALLSAIDKRSAYEIMLEYGLLSDDGRSLTSTECSGLYFDEAEIEKTAEAVKARVEKEYPEEASIDVTAYRKIIIGYLDIMRGNGAFSDVVFNQFIEKNGNSYYLTNDVCKWMPNQAFDRYVPKFPYKRIAKGRKSETFEEIYDRKYLNWLSACLDYKNTDVSDFPRFISSVVFEEAVNSGIMLKLPSSPDIILYGLNKEKAFVTDHVVTVRCNTCGSSKVVSKENINEWEDSPCLRPTCTGKVHEDLTVNENYFGSLYKTGDLFRINAREHTGLLNREDRQELEKDFKLDTNKRKYWDPNILSCTPTMEMGIDIGDLSTVVLCDIPPAESSFLQRVGRAGRKDGNALTLIIAQTKPHDQYFYADPSDMVNGLIQPPRVFLSASAVLERQFIAYCMDSWVKQEAQESDIPGSMKACIDAVDNSEVSTYPNNFLKYVKKQPRALLKSFFQMFSNGKIDEETKNDIQDFVIETHVEGKSFYHKVLDAFRGIKNNRDAIQKNIDDLNRLIKDYENKPKDSSYDEEIKELRNEKNALTNVIREINKKTVFEFLSDESVLPNYAFPESGIILKAILYRKTDDDNDAQISKSVYEYSRSSASAISEFAPDNTFYANGHQMNIDQVDLTTAKIEKWRLCPNCSHAELESAVRNTSSCPVCGIPAWADSGQVKDMLKVQMVYSKVNYRKDLIDDSSDSRSQTFYNKMLFVDIDERNVSSAYEMDNDDFPFGFDYVKKATLREINFGKDSQDSSSMMVAGENKKTDGFTICKHCGRVANSKGRIEHTRYCPVKQYPDKYKDDVSTDAIFLYREFDTEVLRMLIPSTTMDDSLTRTESFAAAFMLGMKEHFGNVDHLNMTVSEFPLPDSGERKRYLVVYDTIPGGTGYLKQVLEKKDTLVKIFEESLKVMETCTCNEDPQKDGCYHCLYAYRSSRNIGNISRREAEKLLVSIISGKDNIKKIKSLNDIEINPLLESELERQFINTIGEYCDKRDDLSIEKIMVNNKEGFLFKNKAKDNVENLWEIEPQVTLDELYGVSVRCKPDFVIWPVTDEGKKKPVAVFTDGFTFHKDIVDDDTLKRMSIIRSYNFVVWSLSYDDVNNAIQATETNFAANTLNPDVMPNQESYHEVLKSKHCDKAEINPEKQNAFELLMKYLCVDDSEMEFKAYAQAYSMGFLQLNLFNNSDAFNKWNKEMNDIQVQVHFSEDQFVAGDTLFGSWSPKDNSDLFHINSGVSITKMRTDDNTPCAVVAILEDREQNRKDNYKYFWNGFWHFFNVMQFDPNFAGLSQKGLNKNAYMSLQAPMVNVLQTNTLLSEDSGWNEVKDEVIDNEVIDFIIDASSKEIVPPDEVGKDLVDSNGEVVGTVELAWDSQKIGYMTADQCIDKEPVEALGWTILDKNSVISKDIWRKQ